MPAISIVTPTYNRGDLLARAIESVRAQTLRDYEHIIVDDGSTDDTQRIAMQAGDPRIVYLRLAGRQGANAARNRGWQQARSTIVTFLDSDDEFLPHRLANTASAFVRDAALDLALSSFVTVRPDRRITNANPERRLSPRELRTGVAAQLFYMATSAITVRRAVLEAVGGFDEALPRFQDGDLLLRIGQRHGANLRSEIDWVKHDGVQSITRGVKAVPAYAALRQRNRAYAEEFPEMLRYMVGRAIVADLAGLRPLAAWRSLQASRQPPLSFSAGELASGYLAGKRQRRSLKSALWRGDSVTR